MERKQVPDRCACFIPACDRCACFIPSCGMSPTRKPNKLLLFQEWDQWKLNLQYLGAAPVERVLWANFRQFLPEHYLQGKCRMATPAWSHLCWNSSVINWEFIYEPVGRGRGVGEQMEKRTFQWKPPSWECDWTEGRVERKDHFTFHKLLLLFVVFIRQFVNDDGKRHDSPALQYSLLSCTRATRLSMLLPHRILVVGQSDSVYQQWSLTQTRAGMRKG